MRKKQLLREIVENILKVFDSETKVLNRVYTRIHVAGYMYPGRATCIRIQVDTCRRNATLTTILSPIQDTCRRRQKRQGIQVDTTCIRATCILV